jgi:hypothetical protein
MSYDLLVYSQRERLLDPHRFVTALAASTRAIVLDEIPGRVVEVRVIVACATRELDRIEHARTSIWSGTRVPHSVAVR